MKADPMYEKVEALPVSGSEMTRLMAAFDWSATPLGGQAGWPQSLKTIVRVMLDSRYAMWLGWGPELIFFYNDAYAQMTLGPKHPWALGRPAREVWSEIWSDIGPRAESVLSTGQATWDEGLLLFVERRGFAEESYHTFSYSPVPDDTGNVGGMLCVVTEDTERTIGERRLRTLRDLAARTNEETLSVGKACATAARTLGENPRDVSFALIYLVDTPNEQLTLCGRANAQPDTAFAPQTVALGVGDAPWPFAQAAGEGSDLRVDDLLDRFGHLPAGTWPQQTQAAVVLPLAKPGQGQLAGFMVAGLSPWRPYDDAYRGFLQLVAGQIATSIANARAVEEERARAESLAELDRAKTAFFSNISHEFRTPLTLMLGPLEDALADAGRPPSERAPLQLAHRNSLRLLKLVNTLLDFSRLEAGRTQASYEATDLSVLTAELASLFRSAIERAGLTLVLDCPPLGEPVLVDRDMWEKIVFNLLSNALKFTFEGAIEVLLRRAGDSALLSVRDTGTGIPAEELSHVFERFHRVKGAKGRSVEGSGIGLALVQELVKLHGGSVSVESRLGGGSTFSVEVPFGHAHLPAERIGAARAPAVSAPSSAAYLEEALRWLPGEGDEIESGAAAIGLNPVTAKPRIVLADDNADMRDYVRRLLDDRYQVTAVGDGLAALAAAREQTPDLVLSDVMMPGLDGFALLHALRSDERLKTVPVILLSARAGEEASVEGLQAGADDYLVKPFSARELLARVSARLEIARIRREAEASARESEARMALAINATRMITWQWDVACDRITASSSLAEVYGLSEVAGLDEGFKLVLDEDRAAHQAKVQKVAAEGGGYTSEFRVRRPDSGQILWLEERGTAIVDAQGVVTRLVGVTLDVSERKAAEEMLRDADRRKDEFLATLAHELRNPLAPLRNALEIMRRAGDRPEQIRPAAGTMERQFAHLVRLVDDLLDVSRISRGKLELKTEALTLSAVIEHALETSAPLIEREGHHLVVDIPDEPLHVQGDEVRLAQVFSNLLNNAARYTDRGGTIELVARRSDAHVEVSVKDSGIGIPRAMLPRVFDMFTQVDRTLERSRGGLGVGLSLVQRIVQLHGGTVEAKSSGSGQGSEFIVRLPLLAQASATAPARAAETPARAAHRRVLVVDDNRDAAESLAAVLELMGNQTRVAHDGIEALQVAAEFVPEVMLIDIGMPKMNGYELARTVRSQPRGADVRLIALTGWGQDDDKQQSKEAGFDLHLTKPADPAALEKLLAPERVA